MLLLRPVRPHTVAACVYGTRFFGGSRAVALRNPQLHNHAAAALVMLEDEKLLIRTRRHQPLVSCGTKLMSSGRRSFSIRVTSEVNDSGSIDSPLLQSMEKKIKEHLNAELVIVKDAYGDGRHVSIHVVSSAFEGQSAVNRQRMVYKAIWEELQNTVHAVDQMTTITPNEAAPPGN